MSTFALVHGAWLDGSAWSAVVPPLEARGHEVIAPDLPIDDPDALVTDYAQVVLDAIGDARDVVVVGHSFGSEAAALVAADRPVRGLVYLCPRVSGFDRPPGEPQPLRPFDPPDVDVTGRLVWSPAAAARLFPPALAGRVRPQATQVWQSEYPLDAPPAVPSAFVIAADDEVFDPHWSHWAAREVLGLQPMLLQGGHFPMAERPAELAQLLCDLAEGPAMSLPSASYRASGPQT
jgi:pimeloyl-ACP methyl ester carboxylesterase